MQCSACGHENRTDARFCSDCGASLSLEIACPSCGRANPAGVKFCDGCGQGLSHAAPLSPRERDPRDYTPKHLAEKILTSRSALQGERKQVTVLFCDLVESTPLAESIGPEEMHAVMDRCFQIILEQVHGYEGTVNQFLGDGVMALFGAPLALEDAPRRACLAALAIQQALKPLRGEVRARHGIDLQWRIGIHSGPVVVGRIGDDLRMDYTAVGDTTNLAARLEKAAPPGGILISEKTGRFVFGLFEVEDLGELRLKGKSASSRVFRVLCERRVSRLEAAADAGLTPLCGRGRELAALRAALDNARDRRGQVVFVVGEAGIGKSRLLHEFRRQLGDEPHTWFLGLCIPYGRAAFQPIVDGLRRLVGIEDRDDEKTALARVDEAVRRLGPGLDWTLPFVRHLLSLPVADAAVEETDPITRRSQTVKALNAVFLSAAAHQPLIFVIEDAHWIDPASEEFLAGLADSVPASRVLLVLTHRPGYAHPFGDRSYHTRIAIQALSEPEMAEMAGALLDAAELPDAVRSLITGKAEGNPLFVEEVTKSLIEAGILKVEGDRVELARELGEVTIPDRIQDVLMARIDRLDETPKQAIQVASVIGREFALRLLERIIEVGDALRGVVEELRALELIYEKAAHPELAFMFKHALTHDVAYESVLVSRRKALHAIVGAAIEELYRDRLPEHYEKLAHHFERAEVWEKALEYHYRAAEKAARTYANRAAAEHCRRALAIAQRLPGSVPAERLRRLEEQLGGCCLNLSEFHSAGEAFIRAAEHAVEPPARAYDLARAAYAFMWGHEYRAGQEAIDSALSLARVSHAPAAESFAIGCQCNLGMVQGTLFDRHLIDQAVELAERAGDAEALVWSLSLQAGLLERAGEFRAAIASCERAMDLARPERNGHMAAFAQWFLGISQCCLGQYGRAITTIREAFELCERIGDHAVKPRLLNTLGWCFAEFNCHERAIECNEYSTELAREMVEKELVAGAPELYANGSINLAGNRIALGDVDGARRALEPIEDDLARGGDSWMRWRYSLHLLDAQARIALVRGDLDRVLELSGEELEGARRTGSRKLEARALELRGRALVTADLREDARASLSEASRVAAAIGYPPVVWRTHSLLAELARRAGDRTEVEHHTERARALVASLSDSLSEPELRRPLDSLGEQLVSDPLRAYR